MRAVHCVLIPIQFVLVISISSLHVNETQEIIRNANAHNPASVDNYLRSVIHNVNISNIHCLKSLSLCLVNTFTQQFLYNVGFIKTRRKIHTFEYCRAIVVFKVSESAVHLILFVVAALFADIERLSRLVVNSLQMKQGLLIAILLHHLHYTDPVPC